MNTGHNNAAAIAVDIAKGWRPNYYLTNMFQYMQALEATISSTKKRSRKTR